MKIAFFTYPEWAFGAIHDALCKELYKHGIYAHILNWERQYTVEEFQSFMELFDVFCTAPGNAVPCLNSYGVPNEKIVAVAHGRYDIQAGIAHNNKFDEFKTWGGVSPDLADYAKMSGVNREMIIAKNGIHFDNFYAEPAKELRVIGYGGALEYKNHLDGNKDLKRGYLVKRVADGIGLPINLLTRRHYLGMPAYYPTVDSIMVSSTEESCGLPLMEAAAAGRLPISTHVGVTRDYENTPNLILPMAEEEFISGGVTALDALSRDSDTFSSMCKTAQEFARENYDWSVRINDWVKLFVG